METIKVKNYCFWCWLLAIAFFLLNRDYNLDIEELQYYAMLSGLVFLPFELVIGRIIYRILKGKDFILDLVFFDRMIKIS